jgi:NADH:ubiquinone oxidoreductase subunit 5 (subunit L)/multisubunit Na+/H+ antiporter MnhA subunit
LPVHEPSILLPIAVALPFLAALVVGASGRRLGHGAGWIVLAAALGSTGALVPPATGGALHLFRAPWLPVLDVWFALRADGFALLLALLVAGIGALVALYSLAYMADEDRTRVRRFYAALAAFMGSMLGIALADDLILLFVFWELTSITSFLLIGYRFEEEEAKAGALTALQVTALGGLAMSVGFLLIGQLAGTFSIARITASPDVVARLVGSPLGACALVLVLLGAFTKSAQVPFHFWLPRAMVAPTPVSTYLHAATMVKAGVFLLGRMQPIFGESAMWAPILVPVGAVSMLLGAYQAFREVDLKAILARTTASALGVITLLYGLGATQDASLQILNHAVYKGALFLVAGIVEHHAHTRRIDQLGGLRRALPVAFVACALASLSMAGVPPLLGFVAKDSAAAALLHGGATVVLAASVANAFLVATACRLTLEVFLGPERRAQPARHAANLGSAHGGHASHTPGAVAERLGAPPLWLSPSVLAFAALALGLASAGHAVGELVAAAASGPGPEAHVHLLPGVGLPLVLSLLALLLGVAGWLARERVAAVQDRLSGLPAAASAWDRLMAAIPRIAEAFSERWQNGSLRWYLAATASTLPLLAAYAMRRGGLSWRQVSTNLAEMPWYGFLYCLLLAVATVAAVRARTRLAAIIATTSIGFLVAMMFVVYRSPDILLTQVLIETVSTIFVLLVLVFLPAFPRSDLPAASRLVNMGVAAAFGLTITLLLLLAMTPGMREPDNIAVRPGGLLSLALAEGGGRNAVNVIIVDIRALDTTGEITVVVVVGLCVYGLLRARRKSRVRAGDVARREGKAA